MQDKYKVADKFFKRLPSMIKDDYKPVYDELETMYKDQQRLPSKINLSEPENKAFDKYRIEYVLKATACLSAYYAEGKSPIVDTSLNSCERELLDALNTVNTRRLLEHIAVTIFNMSGSVRSKYKHLLSPAPFTWETFEHFGGLMRAASPEILNLVIRNVQGDVAKRLFDEYAAVETTVEAALAAIVNDDVPKLKLLFLYIQKSEEGALPANGQFPPVELTAIKALTRRVIDTENLIKLLKYTDNHVTNLDHREISEQVETKRKDGQIYMVEVGDTDKKFQRQIDLSTKLGQHAALRRLEMVGELITGKYLSSWIKDLDLSIDWLALIELRNVIAHQDEGDNIPKVQQLLSDQVLFEEVLGKEMTELFLKLTHIVTLRDAALPKFLGKPELFWESVYEHEKKQLILYKKAQLPSAPMVTSAVQARVEQSEIDFIGRILDEREIDSEIQRHLLGILDGTGPIPDRKTYGALMQSLPSRKENKELAKKCRDIFDEAVKPKASAAEREAAREAARKQVRDDAAKRQQEIEAKFTGLVAIRRLAVAYKDKVDPNFYLTPRRRIDAAIQALENIKQFMEEDIFIKADFNFSNVDEWGKAHKDKIPELFARLVSSSEFNDALEYNAAQLLQHLDTICEYPEAKGYLFIDKDKNYETMRCLRNWLEHGNHLHDKDEYDPGSKPSLLQNRQKVVAPIMISLIFNLLPDLYEIKKHYLNMQDICSSCDSFMLWKSVKTKKEPLLPGGSNLDDINEKSGPGYGF